MALAWTKRTAVVGTGLYLKCIWAGGSIGKFIAVGQRTGVTKKIATSPDGITWTAQTVPQNNAWQSVAFNGTTLVAVSTNGVNQVMTSTDGVTWNNQSASEANSWSDICWSPSVTALGGVGQFVAVAGSGTHRVMTSPDGVTWTNQTAVSALVWGAIDWSPTLQLYVATAVTANASNIMTSPDGITWTARTNPVGAIPLSQCGVVWGAGAGKFVAGFNSFSNHVLASSDGLTWTDWVGAPTGWGSHPVSHIAWSPEFALFLASSNDTINLVVTSPDGNTWTTVTMTDGASDFSKAWGAVGYSPTLQAFAVMLNADSADIVALAATALSINTVTPNLGVAAGGTNITIVGSQFVPGMLVNIGGTACTNVVVVNSTTITCTTGAHVVGLYDVTVTIASSFAFATLTNGFTYIADFTSSNAFIVSAGGHGPMAGGTTVTITGTFFAVGVVVYFDGIPATNISVPNSTTVTCQTPPHQAGVVDVKIGSYTVTGGFTYDLYPTISWPIPTNIQYAPAMSIEDVLNDSPNMCKFRGINVQPTVGRDVQFDFGDAFGLLFAGTIQTVDQIFQGKPTSLAWDATVIDYTWLLNRRVPFGTWSNISLTAIVLELLTNFSTGFSSANVQAGLPPVSITLNGNKNFATCLTDMSQLTSPVCKWFVDYRKVVHFFST